MLNPAWTWQRPLARVTGRRVEAQDVVTLTLAPNRHCGTIRAGQHLNVGAEINGRRVTRSYSISNVPGKDRRVEITIKRIEDGKMSTHLSRKVGIGDVLTLDSVFGAMSLPPRPQGNWLLLAAGSGITPLISLTRALALQAMPVALTLVYWVRTRAELCFTDALRALAAQYPNFRFLPVLTREAGHREGEFQGRLSAEWLRDQLGSMKDRHVRACGPHGFVELARTLCAPGARDFVGESFTPPPPADLAPTTVRVSLLRSGQVIEVPTGKTLLAGLEAQGLSPAHGCRMGICRTCVCAKRSGVSHDLTTGFASAEPDSALRLCVSQPRSDLSLDL